MARKMTIKEFALLAGVSVSTVSKALNDNREISQLTKNRLKLMARELGYFPNDLARGLKKKRTGQIGLVLYDLKSNYSIGILKGVERRAKECNLRMLLTISDTTEVGTNSFFSNLIRGAVDGIIVPTSTDSAKKEDNHHCGQIVNRALPIIYFDSEPKLNQDNFGNPKFAERTGRKIVDKLLGLINSEVENSSRFNEE